VYSVRTILEITARYGGDNYRILASINQKLDDSLLDTNKNPKTANILESGYEAWDCKRSGDMYAWKRCYVEVDEMFRAGAYLDADAAAGQKQIQLKSVAGLAANDKIYVFECDKWNEGQWTEGGHEYAEIDSINAETKTVTVKANLTNAYAKGASGEEAAVGKLVGGGTLENCNEASTFFLADLSLLKSCYDPAFVEFKELPDGVGPVPYKALLSTQQRTILERQEDLRAFSQPWFKNKDTTNREEDLFDTDPGSKAPNQPTGKKNYFHVIGAVNYDGSGAYGVSYFSMNAIFVFVKTIEDFAEEYASLENQEVTAHEIGHQFQRTCRETWAHCSNKAFNPPEGYGDHDDKEGCIMNTPGNRTNGKCRFCLKHIMDGFYDSGPPPAYDPGIRDQEEGK
jgi:hypothetical protein